MIYYLFIFKISTLNKTSSRHNQVEQTTFEVKEDEAFEYATSLFNENLFLNVLKYEILDLIEIAN